MAGSISSLGVGAGLNGNDIVAKLMAVENQSMTRLNTKLSGQNAKISSFGLFKTALASLQTAAKTLASPSKLSSYTATLADTTKATATTAFNASAGTYSINVTQLAAAQKRLSNEYASGAVFGAGTLDFTVGGVAKPVSISAGSSLNDIRAAINEANIGVTAAIVSGVDGSNNPIDRLILTSKQEGTSGSFSLAVASGDPNLDSLATFDLAHTASVNASDAALQIEGVSVVSSSNTISTALNGVTLNLKATGATTLTVSKDSASVTKAVEDFIKNFNEVVTRIKTDSAYDAAAKVGKPLNAEATVRTVEHLLAGARTTIPTSLAGATYQRLSELGISVEQDGRLKLDSSKLSSAMSASSTSVEQTLNAYGTEFASTLDKIIGTKGILEYRVTGLNSTVKMLNADKEKLQWRLEAVEKRYRAQFTALDKTVGMLQTTSSYLTQQLAKL
jgi:flagellar hook-associated protein 2